MRKEKPTKEVIKDLFQKNPIDLFKDNTKYDRFIKSSTKKEIESFIWQGKYKMNYISELTKN